MDKRKTFSAREEGGVIQLLDLAFASLDTKAATVEEPQERFMTVAIKQPQLSPAQPPLRECAVIQAYVYQTNHVSVSTDILEPFAKRDHVLQENRGSWSQIRTMSFIGCRQSVPTGGNATEFLAYVCVKLDFQAQRVIK
jgi:hypothetical protein